MAKSEKYKSFNFICCTNRKHKIEEENSDNENENIDDIANLKKNKKCVLF
jgi:hypothetical protein